MPPGFEPGGEPRSGGPFVAGDARILFFLFFGGPAHFKLRTLVRVETTVGWAGPPKNKKKNRGFMRRCYRQATPPGFAEETGCSKTCFCHRARGGILRCASPENPTPEFRAPMKTAP